MCMHGGDEGIVIAIYIKDHHASHQQGMKCTVLSIQSPDNAFTVLVSIFMK